MTTITVHLPRLSLLIVLDSVPDPERKGSHWKISPVTLKEERNDWNYKQNDKIISGYVCCCCCLNDGVKN